MNAEKQSDNSEQVQLSFSQAYMMSLRSLEQYKINNPKGGSEHAVYAAGCRLSQMLEAMSIFAAAQNAILAGIVRNMQADGTVKDLNNFAAIAAKVTASYASELDFACRMEKMSLDAVLEDAGVNPEDPKAVAAYFAARSTVVIEDAPESKQ